MTDPDVQSSALTLEQAKSLTIERRDEIAALFPVEFTADTKATDVSKSLLPCTAEDTFGWPGRVTITVAGEPEQAEALEPIATAFESREGWTVARGTTSKGAAEVVLDHDDGTHVSVAYFQSGAEVWVDAVSPCFTLPGGYVYGTEY